MIIIKSKREIELMKEPCKVTAELLDDLAGFIRPGISTMDISEFVEKRITGHGMTPTFKGYGGFPAAACVSVNEEVIHGIPNAARKLREGDIVSIDVGATKDGYVGDCAATFIVGNGDEEAKRLIAVTRQSFFEGIKYAREGYRISDISHAIQEYVESNGFSVVREYVGHGVGAKMHEDPEVPNYGRPGHGPRLMRGMTIAVEPMVNMGGAAVRVLDDEWTVVTADGSLAAHYENTILITPGEPEILTVSEVI